MTFHWYDWAGYLGVLLVLLAYFLLQARKLHGNNLTYQLMNILGAFGVLLSLTFGSFNRPNKISDATLALWGCVLRALPRSSACR